MARTLDENPLDSAGRASRRAWLYSGGTDGKPHKRQVHHMNMPCTNCRTKRGACTGKCCAECDHPEVLTIDETRAYAPAPLDDREQSADAEARRSQAVAALEALDPDERRAWDLHELVEGWRNVHRDFPASTRREQEAAGWYFVKEKRGGSFVEMSKQFQSKLTYVEIGERMNLDPETVRAILQRARRKMRVV